MRYCSNCGTELTEGINFCPECGKRVSDSAESATLRKQVYDGTVHKCPSCGEVINAFVTKCPTCGYELRDVSAASTVKAFADRIEAIEKSRVPLGKLSGFANAFGFGTISKTDTEKISLIRNYTIPNTKEDIFEFMILAVSNISPASYNDFGGNNLGERKSERQVSEAWVAKYLQAYNKARLSFGNSPELQQVEKSYIQKQKEIRREKMKLPAFLIGDVLFLVFLFLLMFGALNGSVRKERALDNELNSIVAEIQVDMEKGDYDVALVKANSLRYDSSISSSKAKQWDERREELTEIIIEAKKGAE